MTRLLPTLLQGALTLGVLNLATLPDLALAASAEDYPFGRLFTDQRERQKLDELRRKAETVNEEPSPVPQLPVAQPAQDLNETDKLEFSGYIKRADGTTVLWVNGASDMTQQPGSRKLTDGTASFMQQDKTRSLKPGQTWIVQDDAVYEPYQQQPVVAPTTEDGLPLPDLEVALPVDVSKGDLPAISLPLDAIEEGLPQITLPSR